MTDSNKRRTRRSFSDKFKREAVALFQGSGVSVKLRQLRSEQKKKLVVYVPPVLHGLLKQSSAPSELTLRVSLSL